MKMAFTCQLRLIIFLFSSAFFLSQCDTPPPVKEVAKVEIVEPKRQEPKKDTTSTAPDFPKLTDDNIESFLSEYFKENLERNLQVITRVGTLKVRLFDETPLHTANFLMMTKRNYFTGTEFIRVVPNFVVQGGNNESEIEKVKRLLIGSYTIPSEFKDNLIHKKGVLSMARSYEDNPDMKSSPYYFFFVHGQKFNEPQLLAIERDNKMTIPNWKRDIYGSAGGAPHLDMKHTVFGEIYEGLDVLDKMANVRTDGGEWPLEPLVMQIDVIDE